MQPFRLRGCRPRHGSFSGTLEGVGVSSLPVEYVRRSCGNPAFLLGSLRPSLICRLELFSLNFLPFVDLHCTSVVEATVSACQQPRRRCPSLFRPKYSPVVHRFAAVLSAWLICFFLRGGPFLLFRGFWSEGTPATGRAGSFDSLRFFFNLRCPL